MPAGRVVAVSERYVATAKRWKHGWELHVEGVGVTQVRTLATADQQIRDLVETMLDVDASDAEIVLDVTDPAAAGVTRTKVKTALATALQLEAAAEARREAHQLREAGYSVSDIAVVMDVSRGRVSQLLVDPKPEAFTGEVRLKGVDYSFTTKDVDRAVDVMIDAMDSKHAKIERKASKGKALT